MTEVLLEPTKFFEKTKERPPRPWLGYSVVLLASLVSTLASRIATRELPSPSAFGPNWVWEVVGVIVGSLAVWGLLGFLLHLLTGLGPRAFELAGWTFAPGIVLGLVVLAVAALVPVEAKLPPPPTEFDQLRDWLKGYEAAIRASTYGQVSRVGGILGTLWGAWILYAGTRVFAEKRAALVVGVFLAIELAFTILGLLKG